LIKNTIKTKDLVSIGMGYQIAVTYSNLGFIYEKLSRFKEAEKYHLLALKIFQNLYKKDANSIATTYNNLAFLYSSIGRYDKALKFYKKALFIDNKNLYENYSTISITLNNLGELYSLLGDYPKSMKYYQDTLKIDVEHNGKNHTSVAHSYNNIAHMYELLEDYTRAKHYYDKALTIAKSKLDKNHPFLATIYANLGNLYYVMEEDIKSFQKHKKALDIRKILAKGEPSIDLALSYHAMGLLYQSSEDYNKSLEYFQKTLDINKKLLSKDNIANSVTYSSMGTVYQQMDKKKKALEFHLKALTLEKKILGKNHRDLARSYNSLSLLFFSQKNNKKAYKYIKKAFKIFNFNKNQNFTLLDNRQKTNYTEKVNYYFNNLLYLINLNRSNQSFQEGFNYWLNYKGTLFEYQNILSMVKNNPNTPKEVINTINKLNQLNTQLSNTKEKGEEKKIEEKIHKVEIELSKKNESLKRILNLNDINTTQIANHLKPHQLYIDFARGNDNYYIFTLDNQNNISFQQIDENRSKKIDQNIKIYRENTKDIANKLGAKTLTLNYEKASNKKAKNILSQLYNDLIEEYLKEIIKGKTNFIISPDGLLNYFPFEALYHKGKYLVEGYTINYISSGKEFVRQTKLKPKQPKREMILFANADFNAKLKAYTPHKNDSTLAPRFGNRNEVQLEKVFATLGRGEVDVIKEYYTNPLIFENKNATIKSLMEVPSSKILHLSTHGLFLEDKKILNPMKQSVLIFAGGNENLQQSTITALQLSALNLQHTELVVLSACQSGLGEIQNAEGVVGLPKALLQAGAKNVIMSLWTVSNVQTTQLMHNFYANISNQQNYNTSLQNAKIQMITMHPYYWSAFILSGL
jgi:CHAT domain-containing protein/Tfp pilus assembly protein PilF